jgi:chorismate--pyruvate lyase
MAPFGFTDPSRRRPLLPVLLTCRPASPLRWQPLSRWLNSMRPPAHLRAALLDAGSLTARLIALSQGQFRVEILRQGLAYPSLSEQLNLNISRHQLALVREVALIGNGQPWVFARSVLPLSSLTGRLRRLRQQGNHPLGAFLFRQPNMRRSAIALAHISRHHGYVPCALREDGPLWGRRSVFFVDDKPLLVSEVFLDNLTRILQHGDHPTSA